MTHCLMRPPSKVSYGGVGWRADSAVDCCKRSGTSSPYRTKEPSGTIIIDTPNTYLYLALGNFRTLQIRMCQRTVGEANALEWIAQPTNHS
jgi:hypothetical protein